MRPKYEDGMTALCITLQSDPTARDAVSDCQRLLVKACVIATNEVNRQLEIIRKLYPKHRVDCDGYRVRIHNKTDREVLTPHTNMLNTLLDLFRTYHMKFTLVEGEADLILSFETPSKQNEQQDANHGHQSG